jgi:hypothetical protein
VKKIITYWRKSAQSNEKVGWLLHDFEKQQDFGYTFEEAWHLINEFGAINAESKIKTTEHRNIKEIMPFPPQPSFLDTSWQIKYEELKELELSSPCSEMIHSLILTDEKWKIKRKKDQWIRTHKNLISTWQSYENLMNCIEIAQHIQKSQNIVIYVGASIWQESGLSKLYATDIEVFENHLEYFLSESIEKELANMKIDIDQNPFNIVNLPYVFEFLKIVQSLNTNTKILFETKEGVFLKEKQDQPIDLVIAIGTEVPKNVDHFDNTFFISHEPCANNSKYKMVLHAPISQALIEVESHFVKKGRMICNVCEKRVGDVCGSRIAPVQNVICPYCSSKYAEPYGVLVTYIAIREIRFENYKPNPFIERVIKSTLSIVGKSKNEFHRDVAQRMKELERLELKRSLKINDFQRINKKKVQKYIDFLKENDPLAVNSFIFKHTDLSSCLTFVARRLVNPFRKTHPEFLDDAIVIMETAIAKMFDETDEEGNIDYDQIIWGLNDLCIWLDFKSDSIQASEMANKGIEILKKIDDKHLSFAVRGRLWFNRWVLLSRLDKEVEAKDECIQMINDTKLKNYNYSSNSVVHYGHLFLAYLSKKKNDLIPAIEQLQVAAKYVDIQNEARQFDLEKFHQILEEKESNPNKCYEELLELLDFVGSMEPWDFDTNEYE